MNKNIKILIVGLVLITAVVGVVVVNSTSSKRKDTSDNRLKIGIARPKTGEVSEYGDQADYGVELALEKLKEEKSTYDFDIDVVSVDTEGKADKAQTQTKKLIKQDRVDAIVGPLLSTEYIALGPDAVQSGVPVLSPTSTNPKATEPGKYLFSVAYTDPYQGKIVGKLIASHHKKKVAVIYNNSSDYSKGAAEAAIKELKKQDIDVVAKETYVTGDTDFNAQLQKIKSENPDALLLPDVYADVLKIGGAARPILGKDVTFYGVDGWGGLTSKTVDDSFKDSYFVNGFAADVDSDEVKEFYEKFKEKYPDKEPSFVAANTYDAILVLADAYKEAKEKTPDGIQKELIATDGKYLTGHIKFSDNRFAEKSVFVIKVEEKDGKLVEVYQETIGE